MFSNGTTAIATTDDTAVSVFTSSSGYLVNQLTVINEGGVAGFFSDDGGTTWARLPATSSVTIKITPPKAVDVKVKRVASGSNLSGVYAIGS